MEKGGPKQLIWVTDPHLNFVAFGRWELWIEALRAQKPDGILITGDITEADDLTFQLERLIDHLQVPLYFVLGNHDYYRSSIEVVRRRIELFCAQHELAVYLTQSGPVRLHSQWALVGHDGWADGRLGNARETSVRLNDFRLIGDYAGLAYEQVLERMAQITRQATAELSITLEEACRKSKKILIATHVPPFREACLYKERPSDDEWLPFFASQLMGECLLSFANRFSDHLFHVICGHTHHRASARICKNLSVWTGGAEYGEPSMERLIDVDHLERELP